METVTIARISHFSKGKDGNSFVSKAGKPYEKCLIDTTDGRKLSGFGNQNTRNWREGETVELEVTKNGEYFNFAVPKKAGGGSEQLDRMERMLKAVYDKLTAPDPDNF